MAELNAYRPGMTIQPNPAGGLRSDRYDRMLEERDALQQELSLPSPIQVSADEYRFLSTSLAGLEGKQRDEMKYRLGSAMAFSRNLGITVEQAYAALPALTKAQLDIEYKPDSTTFRSLQDSLAIGVISAGLTDKYDQYKDAYLRGDDVSAIDAEIQRLNGEIEKRQDSAPRWITTKMLQMSLQNIPFMADVFMEGAESYMRAASIGQGMALATGLVGGPATLATAEVGTQIVSIAAAISTIARVWTTKEWTAGEQFYELVNQGADPGTAAVMSELSGWVQGLIEESGGPLTSLNKALGMANKTPREFASKLSAYLFLKGKTGRFIRDIGRFGMDAAAEGFEEVQQQFVDDVTDAITYTLSDMEIPEGNWTTPEEYAEAFAGGVGVAAILGVAPSVITSRIEGRQAQAINALAQSGLSEGQFTAIAKSVLPEDIIQHASEEDINGLLHTVYENNKDKRDKSVLNREGVRTRVQETDKSPEDVNQETAEPTPSIDDEPVRLPSGIYRMNAEDGAGEHVPSGGTRLTTTVTDPSGQLTYADITYIRKGNNIDIQGIDITEGEHLQTEGFRDDILRQFASMYPDYNVTFSNPRFSAESDSVSRVIASNPRGQQYGLNFGLDFSEEDRAGVRERIKLFNFGEEQKSAAVRLIQMLGAAEGKTGVEFFDSRFQGTITEEEFARLFPEEYAKAQAGGGMNAAYIPSSRVPDSLRSASDMGNSVRGILVAGRSANPTSFEHEVIHALMQDKEKQDSFSDLFSKEMNGKKAFWDFVHKSDLYKDSGVKENFDYIESHPELFQKGAQWGPRQHEFIARLEEMYRLSGQSTRPELRGFFQRLTDFFRRIYGALKQEGALSDEIVSYFDSFFGTPEDLQARRQQSGTTAQQNINEILRQEPISAAEFDEFRRRLLSDPDNFDADGNPLAPNGNVSNLTLEQWITVRTPEFKAWFGDWELDPENASKVVDENGEPLVVYHGTASEFSVFDRSYLGSSTDAKSARLGFFFTNNQRTAEGYGDYASGNEARQLYKRVLELERLGRWKEANQLELRVEELALQKSSSIVMPVFLNIRNPYVVDADGASFKNTGKIFSEFEPDKYDGMIVYSLNDNIDDDYVADHYIAINSDQIKSATRNNGQFDAENPDIYFQTQAEKKRIDDEYFAALDRGDTETAQRIVDNQARLNGYISDDDYRMMHQAPYHDEDGFNQNIIGLANGSDLVPSDYLEHPERYGIDYEEGGRESFNSVRRSMQWVKDHIAKGDSEKTVRDIPIVMYRAVPADVKENSFRNGDWITPSRRYAEYHARNNINGPYRIIRQPVKVGDVYWNGDSINEWGYDDGNGYAYRNTKNNRKLTNAVVRDYDGNIVPPSQRFNYRKSEIFFQGSVESIHEKYAPRISNPESWTGKPVREFFRAYRNEITEAIKEYPKVEMDGILLLEGMDASDMPFEKELIQARLLHDILGERIILLPRYATNTIERIFGIRLQKGSLTDGLAALVEGDRFIEFKATNQKNLIKEASSALKNADIAFITVPSLGSDSIERVADYLSDRFAGFRIEEDKRIIIADLNTGLVFEKQRAFASPLNSPTGRTIGLRTADIPATVIKGYVTELGNVNQNSLLDFSRYQRASRSPILFQTPSEQQEAAKAKKDWLLSASDEETLHEIGRGREFVFNTDVEEALTDIRSIVSVSKDYDEFLGFMEAVRDGSSLDAATRRRLRRALRKRLAGERAEVTIPPETILNDTGDYIDTYQMLRTEQESSEDLSAPVSNDIPGVLGADERENAITGDGDENGEIEDTALRRAMETGEEKIENGETERVLAETEENLRELRAEQDELDNRLTEIADNIRVIAPENGAKLWKIRHDIQKKEAELRKLERQIERRSRKTAESAKARYGIEQRTADDEKLKTLGEQLNRLIQQERQISTLARREAERKGKRAQYDRDKARFDAAIQKLKDNYNERIRNMRERQQAQRIKRYKESLASRIMRKVSANTELSFAEKIYAIQALMTEDDRQNLIIGGERWSVELLREMFRDTPNDPMFSALRPGMLDILTKKRPSDFTVEELENLLDAVNELRRDGLRAWQAVVDARAAEDRAIVRAMLDVVRKHRRYYEQPIKDDERNEKGFRAFARDAYYNVINMPRLAQILDNGDPNGPFHQLLVRRNREYEDAQARAIAMRLSVLTTALKEQGIRPSDLFKNVQISVDGEVLNTTLSELVYIHYALNNAKNYQAFAYGVLVTKNEKDNILREMDKEVPGNPKDKLKRSDGSEKSHTVGEERMARTNDRIRALGDKRFQEAKAQADAILAENPKVMAAAEAVLGDLNGNGFERVQRIMREQFNREISKEDFYMPIRRMDWNETPQQNETYEAMKARQLAESTLTGVPQYTASVRRGFTEEREEISPYNQTPINYDFFQIWQNSVRDEEHLVAAMAYTRSLRRVFGNAQLKGAITRTHGKEMMGLIDSFINEVAQPWQHKEINAIEKSMRFLRGGLYTSYLGFRASNIIMQAVTSPLPFLSAGVTPAAYMRQLFRLMSDYDATWQMISELSPMMDQRSFDLLPSLLAEERAAIRQQEGSETQQAIRRNLDRLQEMSLWGLDRVDRIAVGAGWLAIYEREMQRNGGVSEGAARVADDVVLATQPVQRRSEMSRLFKTDNEALKFFTQFTASLNVVFQNIFFDIPMAARNRQRGKFWGTIGAYVLSGALLFLIREEPWDDSDDDGEEEFQWRRLIYSFFSQAVDSVPLISDSVSQMIYEPITGENAFTFFGSEFPPLERLARVPGNITDGDWQKAIMNSIESIGLFSGIPTLAIEDYWDALVSISQGEAPESLWR